MSVTIPYTFTGGTGHKARASEVNANFAALAAKFTEGTGGISDADIVAGAGIRASKLSTSSPDRITQAQMEDKAVDSRVLKSDPNTGAPDAAVATADHIKDGIITGAKLVDATLNKAKLNFSSAVVQVPSVGAGNTYTKTTGLSSTSVLPLVLVRENETEPGVTVELGLDNGSHVYYLLGRNNGSMSVAFNVTIWYLPV